MHYGRWYAHGDPEGSAAPRPVRLCSVEDCDRKHLSGGYCSKHRQRLKMRGTTADPIRVTDMERFQSKLAPANERGCRLWLAGTDKDGYGKFMYTPRPKRDGGDGRQVKASAHRWIYEHLVGPVPAGRMVLHSCDTPACCELTHLRAGTGSDNKQDELSRGRNNPPRGTRNPRAVLTEGMVREMRRLHREHKLGARRQARMWGVNEGTVRAVLNGPNWKHVA